MEAVYIPFAADIIVAPNVEKAMMNIQLSMEESINFAKEKSKNAPEIYYSLQAIS